MLTYTHVYIRLFLRRIVSRRYVYVCMYVYVYVYVYVCRRRQILCDRFYGMCVRMYIKTYAYICIYVYTYVYIYI